MSKSFLRNQALSKYKSHPLYSWLLSVTTIILASAILVVDIFLPMISFVTVPLLVLPIIFSAILMHLSFSFNASLTVRGSIKYFASYYRRPFFGGFRVISTFFKSLLVFVASEFLFSLICSSFIAFIKPEFNEALEEFYQYMQTGSLLPQDFLPFLQSHNYALYTYLLITFLPPLFLAAFFFVYHLSRETLNIYFRAARSNYNNAMFKLVFGEVMHHKRYDLFKDFVKLNWPMFVLLVIGFIGGSFLMGMYTLDFMAYFSCGVALGVLLTMFYFPFFLANNEALFEKYSISFDKADAEVKKSIVAQIKENITINEEDKKRLEEMLSGLENKEEDNKKDPNGS